MKQQQFTLLCVFIFGLLSARLPNGFANSNAVNCSYQQMLHDLQILSSKYPHISRLESIGKTVERRDLLVMIISDQPNSRPLLRPQVKFVGNILGNSGPACYILLKLINHLLTNYENENSLEKLLIQTTEIHVLPNMNPDGFSKSIPGKCDGAVGKYNGKGKNLNRDFPLILDSEEEDADIRRQPETLALMTWINGNNFLTSISYFTGARVVTYPFDFVPHQDMETRRYQPHLTPDDDIFQHLTSTYVSSVEENNWHCPILEKTFTDGKINGAEWSPTPGTMMDYNYVQGTFELFIAVSCCRNENNGNELEKIWLNNRLAMLRIIQESEYALRGQIVDKETGEPIQFAELTKSYQNFRLNERIIPMAWFTSVHGEFWRIILPGKYVLHVSAKGYKPQTIPFEIRPLHVPKLEIKLEPEKSRLIIKRFNPSPSPFLETTKSSVDFDSSSTMNLNNTSTLITDEILNSSATAAMTNTNSTIHEFNDPPNINYWSKYGAAGAPNNHDGLQVLVVLAFVFLMI